MYISNLEDVIIALREKLPDYLQMKGLLPNGQDKPFQCPYHDDAHPSMRLNPKLNYEVAHCFQCTKSVDIFRAAHILEHLPESGSEWISETIPSLAETLNIPISLGEPSEQELLRRKFFALASDIMEVLAHPNNVSTDYMSARKWENSYEDCYSLDYETLIQVLLAKGWERAFIESTKMICTDNGYPIISTDKATWIIKDSRGRPIGFVSRQTKADKLPKYINSGESPIYMKRETLLGLDIALDNRPGDSLFIVEGPGDRMALLHAGYSNVVALCGAALTEFHLYSLKTHDLTKITLCTDWDDAGQEAIARVLRLIQSKRIFGFDIQIATCSEDFKDIDALLASGKDLTSIVITPVFTWLLSTTDLTDLDQVGQRLIPAIASTPAAIKRDQLARLLSEKSGIQHSAIINDVDLLRNASQEKRKDKILASADKYRAAIEADPSNAVSALANHEHEIENIDTEFGRSEFGVNYQLGRWDSIQENKAEIDANRSGFKLGIYKNFEHAMSNGLPWSSGALFYWGGRANAAKTGMALAIALDALINDPDCMLVVHLTDDALILVEPRMVTNTAMIAFNERMSIHAAAHPNICEGQTVQTYRHVTELLRSFIADERLTLLDSEDGMTISVLERTVKHLRNKYPNRKLLVVMDKDLSRS